MTPRTPSQPPVLPGFAHVHALGTGSAADVFVYDQNLPRRQVAVKVMLDGVVDDRVRDRFQVEANLMAQLSSHPSILTVYQASVSSDGRPYLVMELCSDALSRRYREEPLTVAEVLRIAVKVGSAVETAHRAGVLHRDVKPSNILITAYGRPVLSDFGIAASLSKQHTSASATSLPWTAPEVVLDATTGTVASDVWSLAATVYSLVAGRPPFDSVDTTTVLPLSLTRADVPPRLDDVLARALSRQPRQRHASVLELVLDLQAIESELGLTPTHVEVAMDDWALATISDADDRIVLRGATGSGSASAARRRRWRTVLPWLLVGVAFLAIGFAAALTLVLIKPS